jgi:hypothetical protein
MEEQRGDEACGDGDGNPEKFSFEIDSRDL